MSLALPCDRQNMKKYMARSALDRDGSSPASSHEAVDIAATSSLTQPPPAHTNITFYNTLKTWPSIQICADSKKLRPLSLTEMYAPCTYLEAGRASSVRRKKNINNEWHMSTQSRRILCLGTPILMILIGIMVGISFLMLHLNKKSPSVIETAQPDSTEAGDVYRMTS